MNFWKNKKVFITGHTGFKGSWLALWLQTLEANVIGYALAPPTEPNLFTLADIAKDMISVHGDIRNFALLQKTLHAHQPDIVIHMAAQPLVRYSYQQPIETYSTNVLGTVHVLEAARQTPSVKAIINVTTDKCYENTASTHAFREDDRLGGYDPYSNSKACAELVTAAYRNSFFKNQGLASVRAGNVIGGGDWAQDRLIPDIIRACMKQQAPVIRYPEAVRPWQHVLEPLSGYLLLAERLYTLPVQYAQGWNFGPNAEDAKPVRWIADQITALWGSHTSWILDANPQPHEAHYLRLDCTKARTQLGWQPRWNLAQGLHATVRWYQAYQAQENIRQITLAQMKDFTRPPITETLLNEY